MKSKLKLNHKSISNHAIGMVKALQEAGFETYLVGGCVRDLLVGLEPKDFDISTTARPKQVKRVVGRSYIIGRRFRLVLARRGEEQFEISTFRRSPTPEEDRDPEITGDNLFGTSKQDAHRRDFTLNALFYDPIKNQVVDYTGGQADLEKRQLNMIGDPAQRLVEDPIRILRAIRLAHKTNCRIDPYLKVMISEQAPSLKTAALPRKREELLKILRLPNPFATFAQMYDLGVLKEVSPGLAQIFNDPQSCQTFYSLCQSTSQEERKNLESAELFALIVTSLALSQVPLASTQSWVLEDKNQTFMKQELGMFNLEVSCLSQAFKLLHEMTDFLEEFKRKGKRRQVGFLSQNGFATALFLGQVSRILNPYEMNEWCELFLNFEKEWTSSS